MSKNVNIAFHLFDIVIGYHKTDYVSSEPFTGHVRHSKTSKCSRKLLSPFVFSRCETFCSFTNGNHSVCRFTFWEEAKFYFWFTDWMKSVIAFEFSHHLPNVVLSPFNLVELQYRAQSLYKVVSVAISKHFFISSSTFSESEVCNDAGITYEHLQVNAALYCACCYYYFWSTALSHLLELLPFS